MIRTYTQEITSNPALNSAIIDTKRRQAPFSIYHQNYIKPTIEVIEF